MKLLIVQDPKRGTRVDFAPDSDEEADHVRSLRRSKVRGRLRILARLMNHGYRLASHNLIAL